jgi:hypothetical protein
MKSDNEILQIQYEMLLNESEQITDAIDTLNSSSLSKDDVLSLCSNDNIDLSNSSYELILTCEGLDGSTDIINDIVNEGNGSTFDYIQNVAITTSFYSPNENSTSACEFPINPIELSITNPNNILTHLWDDYPTFTVEADIYISSDPPTGLEQVYYNPQFIGKGNIHSFFGINESKQLMFYTWNGS